MIQRHTTAEHLNRFVNHPDVRPYIGADGYGDLDFSPVVSNPNNYCLLGEHGGMLFVKHLYGVYECHTQVLRSGRGEWAKSMIADCSHFMAVATDAYEIFTRVPAGNLAAKVAAITAGMRHDFTRVGEGKFRGKQVDVEVWSIRIQDWIINASGLEDAGRHFHDMIRKECERHGHVPDLHEDDPNHNRYVGAAWLMAQCGQPIKGATMFNRWAAMCQHKPIELVSLDPMVVRMDYGLWRIGAHDIELLREG